MASAPSAARVHVAPKVFLGVSVALAATATWAVVVLTTGQPALGLRLRAPSSGPGLVVDHVYADGPSRGLVARGARLVAIAEPGGARRTLDAEAVIEEPDFLPTYARRRAFFEAQGQIDRALRAPTVTLFTADGDAIVVRPRARRAAWLPFVFWFQLACGLIALLTGATVFALRRRQVSARLYAFTGLSFALITFPAAAYSGRELALPTVTFRWLAAADHLGAMLFAAGFIALVWHYPRRLGRLPVFRLLVALFGTTWILDTWALLPSPDWGIRIPHVGGILVSIGLGVVQWRRAGRDPIGRAAIRWFLLSLLLGGSCFVIAIFVTVWLGEAPMLSQGYAFGLVLSMYLGIAFGVARYRLFQLEQWWVAIWLWVVAGACIMVLDFTLAYALELSQPAAAGIAVLVIGWLYFPARQWLLARLLRGRDGDRSWAFPETVKLALLASSTTHLSEGWRALLVRLFDALHASDGDAAVPVAAIAEEGLSLHVPGVAGQPPTVLRLARRGHRLFTVDDRDTAQALFALLEHTLEQRDAYDRGVRSERERLARDLHDDVGSRLLTLVHRSASSGVAELAREALRELRTVVATLGAGPAPLGDAMADWRIEAADRCDAAGVTLDWSHPDEDGGRWLDTTTRTNILRVLREALSNALHHARPNRIEIAAGIEDDALTFSVSDDGASTAPSTWTRGRGLSNIEQRVAELGGEHELVARDPAGTRLSFRVPLAKGASHEERLDPR